MSSATHISNQPRKFTNTRNQSTMQTTQSTMSNSSNNITRFNSSSTTTFTASNSNTTQTQNTLRRCSLEKTLQNSNTSEGVYRNARFCNINLILVGCPVILKVKSGEMFHGIYATFSPEFEVVLECCHKIDSKNDILIYGRSIPNKHEVNTFVFSRDDIVEITATDIDKDYAIKSAESNFIDSAIALKTNGPLREQESSGVKELQPFAFEENHEEDFDLNAQQTKSETFEIELESTNGWSADDMLLINQTKYGYKSTYNSELTEYTIPVEKEDSEDYRRREEEAEKIAREIESSVAYRENVDKELSDNEEEEQAFSAVERVPNNNEINNNRIGKDTSTTTATTAHHQQTSSSATNNQTTRSIDYNNHKIHNYDARYSNRRSMPDRGRPGTHVISRGGGGGGGSGMSTSNSFTNKRTNISSYHQQQSNNRSFERQGLNGDSAQNRLPPTNTYQQQKRTLQKQNSDHLNTSSLNTSNLSNASTSSNPSAKKLAPVTSNVNKTMTPPPQQQLSQQSPHSYSSVTASNSQPNETISSPSHTVTATTTLPISYSKVAAAKLDQQVKTQPQKSVPVATNTTVTVTATTTTPTTTSTAAKPVQTPLNETHVLSKQSTEPDEIPTKPESGSKVQKEEELKDEGANDLSTKISKLNPFAIEFNPALSQVTSPNSVSSHQSALTPAAMTPSYYQQPPPPPLTQIQTTNSQPPLMHHAPPPPPPLLNHPQIIHHHPQTQIVINPHNGQAITYLPPNYIPQYMSHHIAQPPPPPSAPQTPNPQQQQQQQSQQKPIVKKTVVSINDNNSTASITVNRQQSTGSNSSATSGHSNYIHNPSLTYPPAAPTTPNGQQQAQQHQIMYHQGVPPPHLRMYPHPQGGYITYQQTPHGPEYINQHAVMYNPAIPPPPQPTQQQQQQQNVMFTQTQQPPTSSTPSSMLGPSAPHTPSPMPSLTNQQLQQPPSNQQSNNMNLQINPQPHPQAQQFYYLQSPAPGSHQMPYLIPAYGHPAATAPPQLAAAAAAGPNGQYIVYNQAPPPPHHHTHHLQGPYQMHPQQAQNRMFYIPTHQQQHTNQSYSH